MSDSIKNLYDSMTTIDDVQKLIDDEERESVTLDYKQAERRWNHTAKEKIAKHISAFSNSEGGILIFGVQCDDADKDKPKAITGLHPQNGVEDFDRIVTAAIRPEINGWQRKKITNGKLAVLLVYIPASDAGPHQSMKHKQYFHRSGAQSIAMEHYLVQRYFGKHYHPQLEIEILEPSRFRATYPQREWTHYFSLQFLLRNRGKGNARGCSGHIALPSSKYIVTNHATPYFRAQVEQSRSWQSEGPGPHYFVLPRDIHPGASFCFYELAIAFHSQYLQELRELPFLHWELYAEGMESQKGSYTLSEHFFNLLLDS
ncbi:MAG: ATP-binding protein [Deltaproteobacteria bacterium]|nr:ATP-binding protein [Deltaproteobacteria bacterium]MBN2670326.1 ATP-binding protein [Deltaproteobacteria bacterium]